MAEGFARPEYLVDMAWLAEHLGDGDLRVLDCTVRLRLEPGNRAHVESGRDGWARGHIPGSDFADLPGDLSDRGSRLRFRMPPADQFAEAMSRYGVGPGTRAVLYDGATGSWAARVWWMLRAFGFESAAVLDGGLHKWVRGGSGRDARSRPSPAPTRRRASSRGPGRG